MESLSFEHMIDVLQATFDELPDYRRGKNVRYEISDAAVGAFSVFFTGCPLGAPSFLAHQRDMQRQKGRNNGSSLFGVRHVPTDNQIRNLLDPIEPVSLQAPFWTFFTALRRWRRTACWMPIER